LYWHCSLLIKFEHDSDVWESGADAVLRLPLNLLSTTKKPIELLLTSSDTSPYATALMANNGEVFISWKGDGNDQINVPPVSVVGFTEPAYQN